MKKILLAVVAITMVIGCGENVQSNENDHLADISVPVLAIHEGAYAFCGASSAVPTGRIITIQGRDFEEGCAICPVLTGPSISNLGMWGTGGTWGDFNVRNNPQTPDGTNQTVWSFFWYFDTTTTVPQFDPETKGWAWETPHNRAFIVNTDSAHTSMSNMFAMPGRIIDTLENGIILAECYGPLNEAAVPLRKAFHVKSGMTSITAAKEGAVYPVGTPVPVIKLSDKIQNK